MNYWNFTAVILSIVLGAYLLFAAYRRANRKHRHLRALASVIAVGCLYLLYDYVDEAKPALAISQGEIILLTDGAVDDTVNSLIKTHPATRVYTNEPTIASRNKNAILINQLNEIPGLGLKNHLIQSDKAQPTSAEAKVKLIHVVGSGLEPRELASLNKVALHFYPAALQSNIRSVNWTRQVQAGEELVIQGSINNTSKNELSIMLVGFDTRLDSIKVRQDTTSSFQLQTIPKQSGRAVYSLLIMDGSDTLQHEKIPFETISSDPLKILMLASSPDFENKFLKNWLFSNNYGLAIKTIVSRNKFNTEYLNIPAVKSQRINSSLLSNFNLVIGDATALNQLAPGELSSIKSAVQDEGLGLIIKTDSINKDSRFYNSPFRYHQSTANNQVLHLQKRDTAAGLSSLTVTRPLSIANPDLLKTIISDKDGHVYTAISALGSGRLLSTTIANTYNWVLAGDTASYRAYWSDLIAAASKRTLTPKAFSIEPTIPVIDMPVNLQLESADSLPPVMRVNGSLVAFNQQYNLPFQWKGNFWARKTGWQTTVSSENQPFYWYCFAKSDWKDLRTHHKIIANTMYANATADDQSTAETLTGIGFERYIKIYIIVMFMICFTYLWIEEKFHNSR